MGGCAQLPVQAGEGGMCLKRRIVHSAPSSLLPARPVVAVTIFNLCGDNTNLVEEVGGLKKMLKSKHVCVFLKLKKWQSASFWGRGNLCICGILSSGSLFL